ncbi:histidine kinase [Winogradskyella sp. R77965]|uniref:sensor histidine kinase n=1 Tax=Winogradskyella sp. R77965 TaxID=3093872 RepID=UPI0037DDDC38
MNYACWFNIYKVIIILITISAPNYSQAQSYNFKNFTVEDGLPSTEFYDLYQDSRGYIWFTSDRGIVRYNSYEFETFSLENGLSNMVNFTFYKESENTFWINGFDGSFTFWDGTNFQPFKFNNQLKKYRQNKNEWYEIINIDSNNIYFINGNSPKTQQFSINRQSGKITTLKKKKLECSKNCSNKTKRLVNYKNAYEQDTERVKAILLERGYIYSTGKPIRISSEIEKSFIYNEFTAENDRLFIMSDEGLFQYNSSDIYQDPSHLIKNASITSALLTASNEIWATSLSKGVFKISPLLVENITFPKKKNQNIEGLHNYKDLLYAKSILGEVFIIDKENKSTSISLQGKRGFYRGHNDLMNPNVFYFGGVTYKNGNPILNTDFNNYISINSTRYIEYNYSDLSYYLTENDNKYLLFKLSKRALCLLFENENNMHIGTYDGIYSLSYNPMDKNKIKVEKSDFSNGMRVTDLAIVDGVLWASTIGDGLIYKINGTWKKLHQNILSSMSINSIFSSENNTLWVATNKGLNKLKYSLTDSKLVIESISVYDTSKGLNSNYIKDVSTLNNKIYIATDKGICHFDINDVNYPKPVMHIDGFQTGKEKHDGSSPIIKLNYNQNDIKISYTGISDYKPNNKSDNFYRYKLTQEDLYLDNKTEWKETNNRVLEYLNLEAGRYSFSVQCIDTNNGYSDIKSLNFEITPHFSQTTIFRLLLGIILLISLMSIWKLRSNILKKQLSFDLRLKNAELKTLRNQMNPHFVFNSINTIQNYIFTNKKTEANSYIHTLSKLIRKSLNFSARDDISLTEEIQFVTDYLSLEKMRFRDKFNFKIKIDNTIVTDRIKIPSLISQPIIENAVKHAFKNIDYVGMIIINYEIHYNQIIITILDNGIGFKRRENNTSKHKSFGIDIVKQRLELLNEKNNNDMAKIIIAKKLPKGTSVIIKMPIKKS